MDEQKARDILSGRRKGIGVWCLRAVLRAASWPYALAMRLRRWAYRRRLLPSRAVDERVICVGNLTTGGTGKTPMVAWIVQQLQEAGLSPAILTRGYKAVDGRSDEAELLRELTGVNVVVNPDRVAGATTAIAGGANVLVMDDGFQHQRLRRDLNIVLVDATLPWGYGCCLPRGLLREPKSALKDAHVVVITRADEVPPERLSDLREEVARYAPGASLHEARHRPVGIIDEQGRSRSLSELAGRMACAFCGLGNPQPFFATLEQLHVRLVSRTALNDHAAYDRPLTTTVCGECGMEGCEAQLLLTTQKDYVKIRQAESRRPVWQLQMQLELSGDATALLELLSGRPR